MMSLEIKNIPLEIFYYIISFMSSKQRVITSTISAFFTYLLPSAYYEMGGEIYEHNKLQL